MSSTQSTPTLGVFTDSARAEQTLDLLHQAGFHDAALRLTYEGLTGQAAPGPVLAGQQKEMPSHADLRQALRSYGISTELDYYQHELTSGRTVLIVQAGERRQEAEDILHSHGAYSAAHPYNEQHTNQSPDTDNMHIRHDDYNPNIPQATNM